jgi:hypothetical protein
LLIIVCEFWLTALLIEVKTVEKLDVLESNEASKFSILAVI